MSNADTKADVTRGDHEDATSLSSRSHIGHFTKWKRAKGHTSLLREAGYLLLGFVSLAAVTGLYFWLDAPLVAAAFTYLVVLVLLSLVSNFSSLIVLSFIGACCLSYFFAPPIYSFRVDYAQDLITVSGFVITSFIVNFLVTRVRAEQRERKRAEQALRESEYKLRQIIETEPGLTWSTDSDGSEGKKADVQPGFLAQVRAILNVLPAYTWYAPPSGGLTFVSKRQGDFLGLPKDHPLRFGIGIGAQWDAHIPFLHPDDQEKGRKYWSNSLRTGEGYEYDYRVRDAQGNYRWLLTRTEPLRASDGTLLLWVGATLDIEELKRAEEGLRESEAKFRDYAETTSDWFWEIGPDYKFTLLTENAFGSHTGDRIGAACWDHALDFETEPEKWRHLWATLDSRKPFRDFVYRGLSGNGSPMYVRASGKPVFDANGEFRGYRGTGTDVTALMRAQKEHERLRQLESDLAHMNRVSMMGELAASLSHEITQPIASARNNARAAQNFLDMQPPNFERGQGGAQLRCRRYRSCRRHDRPDP